MGNRRWCWCCWRGSGQPYPDINLIPTPNDEVALQEFVDARRREIECPDGPI
jgi:hypothetical protein